MCLPLGWCGNDTKIVFSDFLQIHFSESNINVLTTSEVHRNEEMGEIVTFFPATNATKELGMLIMEKSM